MRYMTRFLALGGAALLLGAAACQDLTVDNPNDPDSERALSNGEDVKIIIGSSFNTWYIANQYVEPNLAFAIMADNLTASFGNFGMRFNGQEPRIPYANNTASGDRDVAYQPWSQNYAALASAREGLRAINRGVTTGSAASDSAYRGFAYLVQGLAQGNLALIFDKSYILDEKVDPDTLKLRPYTDVSAAAMAKYDSAIALAEAGAGVTDSDLAPGTLLNADQIARLANTMAARHLVFMARNATQNAATNWTKVLQYAEKGISSTTVPGVPADFTIIGDGGNNWWDYVKAYGDRQSWIRVDQKVINLMDTTQIKVWTSATPPPMADTTVDERLRTDFRFRTSVPFDQARGIWFFSNWTHERYVYTIVDAAAPYTGKLPVVLQAENDLIIAEALLRTGGDRTRAVALINNTRVGRGKHNVPASTTMTNDKLLELIAYERDIELMNTGGGQPYYDRRRFDSVNSRIPWQAGTPRHLPVPARELELSFLPVYTFGGSSLPDM